MSNLKQYMGITVSSTNAPHDTFQRNTLRAASFNVCLSKHALGFALIWAITVTSIAFAGEVTKSTNGATGPLAPVLSTKIIVQGSDTQNQPEFLFEVPKAGKAVLRLVNGAKQGAASADRVEGVEITLNGNIVVNPKSFDKTKDVLETWVLVSKGTNQLSIKLSARQDQRVALSIGAPPDQITVAPILNAIVLGGEPLLARANVTGLGLPVPGAQVQFVVSGLGPVIQKHAITGNAGIATAYLSGFHAGEGELRATEGVMPSRTVPVMVIDKRMLTVRQSPQSVRLEAGSGREFTLRADLQEIEGEQDILTLKHVVRSDSGGNPAGIRVKRGFPLAGRVVTDSKAISVSPTIKAMAPGRYTVTTIATVTNKANGKVRESYRTELPVEVVKAGSPDRFLGKPIISPSGVAPGSEPIQITFSTSIVGIRKPPQVLRLERVASNGNFDKVASSGNDEPQKIELRDDGKGADAIAGDGFYSGRLELDRKEETEIYFRFRADQEITVFPITRLPLGARPSTNSLIEDYDRQYRLFANEVIVSALPGVSPQRIRAIVAQVSNEFESNAENADAVQIAGYIPSSNAYLVEFKFKGDANVQGVNKVIKAFQKYSEVAAASPNVEVEPAAAPWYLNEIRADQLIPQVQPLLAQAWPHGAGIGVAIIDNGFDCIDAALPCAPSPFTSPEDPCNGSYNQGTTRNGHATRVAQLIAAKAKPVNDSSSVVGVAADVKLYPFMIGGIVNGSVFELHNVIQCANQVAAIHILNISQRAEKPDLGPDPLGESVCRAVCAKKLVVASSGNNRRCREDDLASYPASYDNDGTFCSCGLAGNGILRVGGSDAEHNRGGHPRARCTPGSGMGKSEQGEIYAPGWGVPADNGTTSPLTNYGTSWAAPLVSGCAAVVGAVMIWKHPGWVWNSEDIENLINKTADWGPTGHNDRSPILNCLAAAEDALKPGGDRSDTTSISKKNKQR